MLDIKFVRENPDAVKENIKKKFQDAKLPLVDEVIEKDAKYRACLKEVESLKAARNKLSKANGPLFGQLKKCDDEAKKAELQAQIDANNAAVKADADKMAELEKEEEALAARIQEIMYTIPQMIDPSVPIGPDDTYNVEAQRFGEPVVPDFPIPYHTEIMESFDGIDMDAAGRVAGNGFYYLLGNIARLHEAVLAYARDFMINKGFTYVIPPNEDPQEVFLVGSFTEWEKHRVPMHRFKNMFVVFLHLPAGDYLYKWVSTSLFQCRFIVDAQWRVSAKMDVFKDDGYNYNHAITVPKSTNTAVSRVIERLLRVC